MTNRITSEPKIERIEVLDVLRGFALLGIFLANIRGFSGWESLSEDARIGLTGSMGQRATDFLHLMLVNGKFYTIFSFLFGVGFALQFSRLRELGNAGVVIYRRRLWLLLGIGFAHMTLLWEGDILALYAALGFTLPAIFGWHDRKLILGAVSLLTLPIVGYLVVNLSNMSPSFGFYEFGDRVSDELFIALNAEAPPQEGEWRFLDDWGAYWAWTLPGPIFRIGYFIESWRIPKVLGIIMLGVWTGRHIINEQLLNDMQFLRRVATIGYLVGIPANAIFAWAGGYYQEDFSRGLLTAALHAIGIVPLGLAYAATVGLLWKKIPKILSFFRAPGRMALTNYLTQTLIGVGMFYGIGLGFARTWPPLMIYSFAAAVVGAQILFSRIWLNHFRQGPMEFVWRLGTYRGQAVARNN